MSPIVVCDASAVVVMLLDDGSDGAWAAGLMLDADRLDLDVERWFYDLLAGRARELRENPSSYDAAHVAPAESPGATLVTLDRRIARAPGPRCVVRTRPA